MMDYAGCCEHSAPQGAVLLAAAAGQGCEANHEEVQPGEGDQVHCQLAQVGIQLPCSSRAHLSGTICHSMQQAATIMQRTWW